MVETSLQHVTEMTEYQTLVYERKKVVTKLSLLMLAAYYIYILVIAFSPEALAQPVGDGPTTWGIVVGLGLIFFSFIITGIAVHIANTEFEPLLHKLHEKVKEGD